MAAQVAGMVLLPYYKEIVRIMEENNGLKNTVTGEIQYLKDKRQHIRTSEHPPYGKRSKTVMFLCVYHHGINAVYFQSIIFIR